MHLLACSLKELATSCQVKVRYATLNGIRVKEGACEVEVVHTAMEEGIACKNDLFVPVLHVPADAVLGVAWRVERLDRDAADIESLAVGGRPIHILALFAADDLDTISELAELE